MIDIDLPRLYALGLSPNDVSNAVQAQNLVLPSGTAKLGEQELLVRLNSSPDAVREIAGLPDQDGATARRSPSATSRRCATASRRRRAWCARTAGAAS